MITATMMVLMVGLMLVRVPVSVSIGVAATAGVVMLGIPLSTIPRRMISGVDSFAFLAIPFFILAGNLMNSGGLTDRIFAFARAAFGWIYGGLAQVNVAASMIFAGMSGSALADLAGLGAIEMRAMRENNYPASFSAAVTLASCTIGPIIPPSIALVIYALSTNTSVGRLFLAGVLAGVVIAGVCMVFIFLYVKLSNVPWGTPEPFSLCALWHTFKAGWASLMAPAIILGCLVAGISTPSELGAIAVAYALIIGAFNRALTWQRLHDALRETVITTSVIMYLVAVSAIMSYVITYERVAYDAADLMSSNITNPLIGILLINIFLLIMGMVLEGTPALLILSPLLLPVAQAYGMDPVQFGIVIVFNLLIGMLTPPVGIGLFVAARVARLTPEAVLRAVWPFYIPLFVGLLILSTVPAVTLWLPNLVFGE